MTEPFEAQRVNYIVKSNVQMTKEKSRFELLTKEFKINYNLGAQIFFSLQTFPSMNRLMNL